MSKKYNVITLTRTAQARSKRLREAGQTVTNAVSSTVVLSSTSAASTVDGHTHSNKTVLDALAMSDGYLYLREKVDDADDSTTVKIKAGYADESNKAESASEATHSTTSDEAKHALSADNAEKWNDADFDSYLNQSVRSTDDVKFKSVSASVVSATQLNGEKAEIRNIDADTLKASSVTGGEVISNNIHTNDFKAGLTDGYGAGTITDNDGVTHSYVDNLYVRKSMKVQTLYIEEEKSIGGSLILSCANGEVESSSLGYPNGDSSLEPSFFRIVLKDKNEFVFGDLVRWNYSCYDNGKMTIRSGWYVVTYSGGMVITMRKIEGEEVDVDALPQVGDTLVQMGNINDTDRQAATIITNDALGGHISFYAGITTPSLSGRLQAQQGALSSISDEDFGGMLKGYGMYAQTAYIKGMLKVLSDDGTWQNITEYASTKFEVASNRIDAVAKDVANNTQQISEVKQTADAVVTTASDNKGNITKLTETANSLVATVQDQGGRLSTVEQTAENISAKVNTYKDVIENLFPTPNWNRAIGSNGYFQNGNNDAQLSKPTEAGKPCTIRMRGHFGACLTRIYYAYGWRAGIELRGSQNRSVLNGTCAADYQGGIDDEVIEYTFTSADTFSSDENPAIFVVGSWADASMNVDAECFIKQVIVAETDDLSLGTLLNASGIDINQGAIVATADNFRVQNNAGEQTLLVDANGKLNINIVDVADIIVKRIFGEKCRFNEFGDGALTWYYDDDITPKFRLLPSDVDDCGQFFDENGNQIGTFGLSGINKFEAIVGYTALVLATLSTDEDDYNFYAQDRDFTNTQYSLTVYRYNGSELVYDAPDAATANLVSGIYYSAIATSEGSARYYRMYYRIVNGVIETSGKTYWVKQ